MTSRDHDIHKGATEDERPSATTNAHGLDDEELPNDEPAIAEHALGAREDGSQGLTVTLTDAASVKASLAMHDEGGPMRTGD
jgi:hypothetical protein